MSLPNSEAAVPSAVNVTAIPAEKTADSQKAFLTSRCAVPPTYPITRGTLASAHGVNDVSTPARSANTGANHAFVEMEDENHSSHRFTRAFIAPTPSPLAPTEADPW